MNSIEKTKKQCVIFDMDGVIFDSERACLFTWTEAASKYGLKDLEKVFYKCIGTNKNQTHRIVEDAYSQEFGAGIADELLEQSSIIFHQRYDGGRLPIKKGVVEILEHLRENRIRCAIASSTRKAAVEEELGAAGLLGYFEQIIGGDSVKISKPDPEIYLLACKAMKSEPGDTFAIEDSYNGIRSANAAGMRPIMVPDMIPADEEMRQLSEVICEDLFAVSEYLNKTLSIEG